MAAAVTTHWSLVARCRGPSRRWSVSNAVSFVKADSFYTCGGGIAGMEMSLALIEEDYGAKTPFPLRAS